MTVIWLSQRFDKFDIKVNVIPNGLENYMAFTINNNFLYALVQNFSSNDFKYLSQVFSGGLLKLVKQRGEYLY